MYIESYDISLLIETTILKSYMMTSSSIPFHWRNQKFVNDTSIRLFPTFLFIKKISLMFIHKREIR